MVMYLDPESTRKVQQMVEDGLFASTDDAIREAVRLLEERDRLRDLRASIAGDVEQSRTSPPGV